jgi:hypothetical protein
MSGQAGRIEVLMILRRIFRAYLPEYWLLMEDDFWPGDNRIDIGVHGGAGRAIHGAVSVAVHARPHETTIKVVRSTKTLA